MDDSIDAPAVAPALQSSPAEERWARVGRWAEYLVLPVSYVREKLQDVLVERRVVDREGKMHPRAETASEAEVAKRLPEYAFVRQLENLGKTREEIRQAVLALLLKNAGYPDRRSLECQNPTTFRMKDFSPYGKGQAFYSQVVGKSTRHILKSHLLEIADALELPALSEERKEMLRSLLRAVGYPDRRSLECENSDVFQQKDFPPYGKGHAFYAQVAGKSTRHILKSHLLEIADTLGFPTPSSEDQKEALRALLTAAGYPDRRSLESENPNIFQGKDFLPYGKGQAFYVQVTGRSCGPIQKVHLCEIADALELQDLSEERKGEMRVLLQAAGYPDRRSLERENPNIFREKDFLPYGKGNAFRTQVTGKGTKYIKKSELLEIADALELPILSEERKNEMRILLQVAGYPDRRSLERENTTLFQRKDFPPYGKGKAFYVQVMGKSVNDIKKSHLREIADALGFPTPSLEERKEALCTLLQAAGYPDRRSLECENPTVFQGKEFPPHGKGHAFYVQVMGKSVNNIRKSHLIEIADALELPVLSEERKNAMRVLLHAAGYPDRRSLECENSTIFREKDFPPYGKARAFYVQVMGKSVNDIKKSHLREIADALGLLEVAS